jgi:hypothetical protein
MSKRIGLATRGNKNLAGGTRLEREVAADDGPSRRGFRRAQRRRSAVKDRVVARKLALSRADLEDIDRTIESANRRISSLEAQADTSVEQQHRT